MFQGSWKIVRCGHAICEKCVKDCIETEKMTHEQGILTIARCNVSECPEFFILPMYEALKKENEIEEVKLFLK